MDALDHMAVSHTDFLTECLSRGSVIEAEWTFTLAGASAPLIVWSPRTEHFLNPLIRKFADRCHDLARTDGNLYWDDIDIDAFGAQADWLMQVHLAPDPRDSTYVHYGRGIAGHFARDMTGRRIADFSGHISQFFAAIYGAAARRREWVLTAHEPPRAVFVFNWRRLVVPLVDRGRAVCGFIVANIPENALRAGLDVVPDPVFVTCEEQVVRYSNLAAQRMFSHSGPTHAGRAMTDVLGASLNIGRSPETLYETGEVLDQVCTLSFGDALDDRFLLTTTGFVHGGRSFYINILRLTF